MPDDRVSATTVINAPADAIFAVLADPAMHPAIDGTGWVRETVERTPLTAAGQIFRMSMYHPNHPDGDYQIANLVEVYDTQTAPLLEYYHQRGVLVAVPADAPVEEVTRRSIAAIESVLVHGLAAPSRPT